MKKISAFDVIGPNMIGPSSSHTAGCVRIGLLAKKIFSKNISSVDFILYGSFANTYKGHGTDKALVAGVLGFYQDDPKIRDSFKYASENNIKISFKENFDEKDVHPNTVDIHIKGERNEDMTLRGVSTGGGKAEITQINGVEIKVSGDYSTLFINHYDTPGIIAFITGILSEKNINIAFMRLYREDKGSVAYTIIEADENIHSSIINCLEQHESINYSILL